MLAVEVSINGMTPSTLTVSVAAPISSVKSTVFACSGRMRTSSITAFLKPASSASILYGRGARALNT